MDVPLAQWPRLKAGYSDDLGATGTISIEAPTIGFALISRRSNCALRCATAIRSEHAS